MNILEDLDESIKDIDSRRKLIISLQEEMFKEMLPFMKLIGILATQIEMLESKSRE